MFFAIYWLISFSALTFFGTLCLKMADMLVSVNMKLTVSSDGTCSLNCEYRAHTTQVQSH